MIPVIICGGIGSKMWPASRQNNPKHFLPLINGKSLFEINYQVLRKKFEVKDIYVSTNQNQAEIAKKLIPEIPDENFILEPEMRNHGPATGLVAAYLFKKGLGDQPFMLVQPDDLREPEEKFLEMFDVCEKLALENKKYITGGYKPDFAVMGVDYLIKGNKVVGEERMEVHEVDKFLWRSTKEAAEEYVANGQALLHANHTCMTPSNFLEMYKKYKPDWYEPLMAYVKGASLVDQYALMPKGPIEDATQHAFNNGEALIVELPFKWIDFGTWESLANYLGSDSNNNFVKTKKHTEIIGLNDLVVVETDDAILIVPKKDSGRVGEVVDKLKSEGKTELL